MTYIIDAYNLINAVPELKRRTESFGMDRVRWDLLNAIGEFADRKGCDCIVVFDGVAKGAGGSGRVRVLSSRNRSADAIIQEHSRKLGRNLTVISSDLEILGTARTNLSSVITSREFAPELDILKALPADKAEATRVHPRHLEELRERSEKPGAISDDDVDEWKRLFGV